MGQSDKASILYMLHAFLALKKQGRQQQDMELCCLLHVQSNSREKDRNHIISVTSQITAQSVKF